jgi:hypothetical protein
MEIIFRHVCESRLFKDSAEDRVGCVGLHSGAEKALDRGVDDGKGINWENENVFEGLKKRSMREGSCVITQRSS